MATITIDRRWLLGIAVAATLLTGFIAYIVDGGESHGSCGSCDPAQQEMFDDIHYQAEENTHALFAFQAAQGSLVILLAVLAWPRREKTS